MCVFKTQPAADSKVMTWWCLCSSSWWDGEKTQCPHSAAVSERLSGRESWGSFIHYLAMRVIKPVITACSTTSGFNKFRHISLAYQNRSGFGWFQGKDIFLIVHFVYGNWRNNMCMHVCVCDTTQILHEIL